MSASRGSRGRGPQDRIQRPTTADSYHSRPRNDGAWFDQGRFGRDGLGSIDPHEDLHLPGNASRGFKNARGGRRWAEQRRGFGIQEGGQRVIDFHEDGFGRSWRHGNVNREYEIRGFDGYGSRGVDGYGSRGGDGYGTRGGDGYGSRGVDGYGRRVGDGYGSQGVDGYGSRGVDAYGRRGVDGYGSCGVDPYGRRGVDGHGSRGVGGYGSRGVDGYGSREVDGNGSRRVDGYGSRGVDGYGSRGGDGNSYCRRGSHNDGGSSSTGYNFSQGTGRGKRAFFCDGPRQGGRGLTEKNHSQSLLNRQEKTKDHGKTEAEVRSPEDLTSAKENDRFPVAGDLRASSSGDWKLLPDTSSRDFQLMLYRQAVLTRESDAEGWPQIVGSCPDMCPAEEREKRSRLRDLAVFERLDSNQSKTTKELAVKKFCRTFSGKYLKESDVRPLPVLCRTMLHLLHILDVDSYPFEVVHDFLFDRTRAIRQEISMQRITNKLAVCVYESIVRFHIVSERELRRLRTSGKVFDSHLNLQQLSKALLSLLSLYLTLDDDSKSLENEAEFYSYYVLLNLGQSLQLTLWFQSLEPTLLRSPQVEFARDVLRCFRDDNYRRFFQLVTKASYLQACLMELYFNEVRASAIKMTNSGSYKLHPFPLAELAELLLMTVDDMDEFCKLHGVAVSDDAQLLAKQAEFTSPKQSLRHYHCQIIEDKRPAKFQEVCSDLTKLFQ